MGETITLFGTQMRGDFVLMLLMVTLIPFLAVLGTAMRFLIRPRNPAQAFVEILSKEEIKQLLLDQKISLKELAEQMPLLYKTEQSSPGFISRIATKIAEDIEWDMAGLIGIIVTVLIAIMVVSGTFEKLPEQILTGWLMILSYYFGKSQTKRKEAEPE